MYSAVLVLTAALTLSSAPVLHAAAAPAEAADPVFLTQLEQKAAQADPRERPYLYSELVHLYTEVASHQIAAGEMDAAAGTLKHISHFTELIHSGLAHDSKRLKNAEMMVQDTARHLSLALRSVSSEDKPIVQSTLRDLNRVNDELLAQVFAH